VGKKKDVRMREVWRDVERKDGMRGVIRGK